MKKVSIVIPVYNAGKYLRNTIESIINQTYRNIEVILVDDGSKDNSLEICNEYAIKDKRIVVVHSKINKGVSHARNKGIDLVTGEYILFIDSDDTINKEYVFEMMKINKDDVYDLVICNFENIYIDEKNITKKKNIIDISSLSGNFFCDYYYLKSTLLTPWGKLYKISIIKEKKIRFSEKMTTAEDYMFNLAYYEFVKKYKYINLYLYNYFQRKTMSLSKVFTINTCKMHLETMKREVDFFEKYNVKNREVMLGDALVIRCLDYMVIKESISYNESKKRLKNLRLMMNTPKKASKLKYRLFLNLINKEIYLPIYFYCLLRLYRK